MTKLLQQRAAEFLRHPAPAGPDYAPGSLAEGFIASYAEEGKLTFDGELRELLELCMKEPEDAAARAKGAVRGYLHESAALLQGMLDEV